MENTETIRLDVLSSAINDSFPNLTLEFVEKNLATNMVYSVNLHFKGIKYLDKNRCVFNGFLNVASKQYGIGTIEYSFNTQEFFRVSYSAKTTKSRRLHTLIAHNKEIINNLLNFIDNYHFSHEG